MIVDVEESCARLGLEIAAIVKNVEGPDYALSRGRIVKADDSTRRSSLPYSFRFSRPDTVCRPQRRRAHGFARRRRLSTRPRWSRARRRSARGLHQRRRRDRRSRADWRIRVYQPESSIGHHVDIDDFASIGPGAIVCGSARLGRGAVAVPAPSSCRKCRWGAILLLRPVPLCENRSRIIVWPPAIQPGSSNRLRRISKPLGVEYLPLRCLRVCRDPVRSMPRISVLIPTHEHATTLSHAVRSVQTQGVDDLEILICGDGVSDEVRAVVAGCSRPNRVSSFFDLPKAPRTASSTATTCCASAKAEIICIHNDDDLWLPGHIEVLERALEDADFVGAMQVNVGTDGKVRGIISTWSAPSSSSPGWTGSPMISVPGHVTASDRSSSHIGGCLSAPARGLDDDAGRTADGPGDVAQVPARAVVPRKISALADRAAFSFIGPQRLDASSNAQKSCAVDGDHRVAGLCGANLARPDARSGRPSAVPEPSAGAASGDYQRRTKPPLRA